MTDASTAAHVSAHPGSPDVTFVPVTTRLSRVDSELWWDPEASLDYGAGPLLYRCMREYYWSKEYATRVLHGYRQFLELKKILEDWDAKILTPSIPVNQMWHQHILDVTNYCHDCLMICGRVIGNDPDGALDEWAHDKRITATKQLLRARFERQVDLDVWVFAESGDESDNHRSGRTAPGGTGHHGASRPPPTMCMSGLTVEERYGVEEMTTSQKKFGKPYPYSHPPHHSPELEDSKHKQQYRNPAKSYEEKRGEEETARGSTDSSSKKRSTGSSSKREKVHIHESQDAEKEVEVENASDFTIRVRTLKGSIYALTVNRNMSIHGVKHMIQKQYGIPEDKQHLLFYGKVLDDRKTLGDCSIPPESGLQLLVRSRRPLDMATY